MKHYVGIDLGTTNSAICSFDGETVRVWKSPEQNDVTPSAIFADRRGNRFYGQRAYNMAPANEKNSATLFKRYLGTSQTFTFESANVTLTPEECSAEILRVLFGYLPEEIRNDPETAAVITVPAAFNQVKKNATMEAAHMAGIGKVALMQEPVAAIMSVMRAQQKEGIFLIYDLGGGTFDISIAENIGGNVNLLAQGGKEMCGGRDWDRMIFDQIVVPWLRRTFELPADFLSDPAYRLLHRMALFAVEQAKIQLSSCSEAMIQMEESQLRCTDLREEELYLDIPLGRADLDLLIEDLITDTVDVTRDTLAKAGLSTSDVEMIVFVGGPTNYKPLRDRVAAELAIPSNTDVNPMTAVAEGASIFAESINWDDERHNRKDERATVETDVDITFLYQARASSDHAALAFVTKETGGLSAEVVSPDTGWTSGRMSLTGSDTVSLPLTKWGENRFDILVYGSTGQTLPLRENRIVITRTLATIGAIPASHSIGVKVLDKLGGAPKLHFLVREGDPLPKKGTVTFKAAQALRSGSFDALAFSLWEGDILYPIEDNRYIGTYKIPGTSFDVGLVPTGAEIVCEYEISDSGVIHLGVSIPCVGADLGNRNFYSRQEGQLDLLNADRITDDGLSLVERIDTMLEKVGDPRLDSAREEAQKAVSVTSGACDGESVQDAYSAILHAKKLVAQVRQKRLKEIRQIDLDSCTQFFYGNVQKYATPSEFANFENLSRAAQRSINFNEPAFDNQLNEMKHNNYLILARQDWFIVEWFQHITRNPYEYPDRARYDALKQQGEACIQERRIRDLRVILRELQCIRVISGDSELMFDSVNVIGE